MNNYNWLEDKYVKNWLSQIGSERSKRNYIEEFPKFLRFVQKTPTKIIESRLKHLVSQDISKRQFWEQQVIRYMRFLESRKLKVSTIKGYCRTVQSFFNHNGVGLRFARGMLQPQPTDEEKTTRKWVLSNDEIRQMYRHCKTARDRSLLLLMYQSGFLPSDIENMQIENFRFYDKNGNWVLDTSQHYYHYQLREKTNIYQCTCISRECIADIEMMLRERGFPKEGNLFVSFRNKPLTAREINLALKTIAQRCFPEKHKQFKTKNLRDSYMIGLLAGQIQQELKDLMVGHKRSGARDSYGSPEVLETPIRQAYEKAFKYLAINGFGSPSHKVDMLEQELDKRTKALTKILIKLQEDNEKLHQQYVNLKEELHQTHLKITKLPLQIYREYIAPHSKLKKQPSKTKSSKTKTK